MNYVAVRSRLMAGLKAFGLGMKLSAIGHQPGLERAVLQRALDPARPHKKDRI